MCTADVPNHRLTELQTANVHLRPHFEEHQFDAAGELLSIAKTDLPFTTDVSLSPIQIDEGTSSRADLAPSEVRGDADRIRELEHENSRLVAKNEQQRLLTAELGHRVRNTLTLVQAMVNQTLRGDPALEGARETLTERIAALGQSHAMLTDESWSGASLRRVVEGALTMHGGNRVPARFQITGPAVRLGPRQALALAMALHELGTNAAKYGALSVNTGRVEISWKSTRRTNGRWLHLCWSEHGGPAVMPPTRRGFGSKLIERALREALDGEVALTFDPGGLLCTVDAHLPSAQRDPNPQRSDSLQRQTGQATAGTGDKAALPQQ
jgi:two-component sensor histidine kinase